MNVAVSECSISLSGKRSMSILMKKCDSGLNRSSVRAPFSPPMFVIEAEERAPLPLHCRRGLLLLRFL
jgi:hypothetical protein